MIRALSRKFQSILCVLHKVLLLPLLGLSFFTLFWWIHAGELYMIKYSSFYWHCPSRVQVKLPSQHYLIDYAINESFFLFRTNWRIISKVLLGRRKFNLKKGILQTIQFIVSSPSLSCSFLQVLKISWYITAVNFVINVTICIEWLQLTRLIRLINLRQLKSQNVDLLGSSGEKTSQFPTDSDSFFLEPIGGSTPKFSMVTEAFVFTKPASEPLSLTCPAQGSPVPSYRFFWYKYIHSLTFLILLLNL